MKTTLKHLLAGRECLHFNLVSESRYIFLSNIWDLKENVCSALSLDFSEWANKHHILLSPSSTDLHVSHTPLMPTRRDLVKLKYPFCSK